MRLCSSKRDKNIRMSELKLPRLLAAAKEFNIGQDTLIEFLVSKGFLKDDLKPTAKLTERQYYAMQAEFQSDKVAKNKAEHLKWTKNAIADKGKQAPKVINKIDLSLIDSSTRPKKSTKKSDEPEPKVPAIKIAENRKAVNKKADLKPQAKPARIATLVNHSISSENVYGPVIETIVTDIILPSQVITDITDFYEGFIGRLSVLDISWCLPDAEQAFKKIKKGDRIQCVVLNIDFKNKQVQLSQKHLVKPVSDSMNWERIERGDEYNASIIEELNNSYILKTEKGIYGLMHKSLINNTSNKLKVKVNSKLDYSDLISFVPAFLEIEAESENEEEPHFKFSFIEDELQSFNKFKRSLLGTNASDDQCEIIQSGFEADDKIFSKEFSTKHILFIQFALNSPDYESIFKQQAIPFFTNSTEISESSEKFVLEKLSKENYWFKINRRTINRREKPENYKEIIEFSLFNEQINFNGEVLTSKNKKENKFVIRTFNFGQNVSSISTGKKWNAKNGSFLFSNQLKILSPFGTLPYDSSQIEILEYALLKTQCFNLINDLKVDASEILKQEGKTLAIIDKFLEYQIKLNDEKKENNLFVDKFLQIPSKLGKISIQIALNYANNLEISEATNLNIRVKKDDDLMKLAEAILSLNDNSCTLTFYKDIRVDMLQNGFYIDKHISNHQFQVQRDIIQDFLKRKIKINHIESLLVNPDKVKTPIIPKLKFYNEDLIRTENEQPDNNQIKAVKKAVGNQNVFLIQGPPGTGKTTVIAEIIEQLVAKGEKILVSGQNHVSVDNVLNKIANIAKLNLLRVGNPDRIDQNLVRYSIDNLVNDYKTDYHKFICNQVKLTQEYLGLKINNTSKESLKKIYNEKVNELANEYGKLKEVFKDRHFILKAGLNELNNEEIEDSISSLNSWVDSNNNDYEILLKPLIYNSVDVVFATCIGIKGDNVFKDSQFRFDTVIIDEAGKANIAETLVAIELGKKVILVGDQMQLPPYMDSSLIDEEEPSSFPKSIYGRNYLMDEILNALKTSFFEFIINRIESGQFPSENKVMLNYQHRMHPNIGKFVSESFYDGLVLMGSRTHLNRLELPAPYNKEVVFFDTSNSNNPYEQIEGYSAKNNIEAEAVCEIILPKLFEHNISPSSIAIIAPYKSQVANIQQYLKNSSSCNFKNIDISTLDSFQGKEYDIIIFSFTRSSNHRKAPIVNRRKKFTKVGFLDDARRLNVAFSRAKKKLILIGNSSTLIDKKSHFDGLFNYTQLFNKLVELSKDEEIGSFVNLADDYSVIKSPFDAFIEKFKVNEVTFGIIDEICISKATGKKIGVFIFVKGFKTFAPFYHIDRVLNVNFPKYNKGTEVLVRVIDINQEGKKVVVQIMEGDWHRKILAINDSKAIMVEIFETLPHGFLVKTTNGIVGLLNVKFNRNVQVRKLGDKVRVTLSNVDFHSKKVKFKTV
jgi:superfamily I DNA and/or RNA helicase